MHRLSYANVMATVAMFIALGGSSYAAVSLSRGQVKTVNLATGAVTSSKVRDRSLLARDFKAGQLPRGLPGAAGLQGPAGPAGSNGAAGKDGVAGNDGAAVKDGVALVRMTQVAQTITVGTAPTNVGQIGGSPSYSGAYSGALKIPPLPAGGYIGVLLQASVTFFAAPPAGSTCSILVSTDDGGSFTSRVTAPATATTTLVVAVPAFTAGQLWRAQTACQTGSGSAQVTAATLGLVAGPING